MNQRELPELIPGDLFTTPPRSPWTRFFMDVINAKTLHWGLVVHPFRSEAGVDYEIIEAIAIKGVAVGLLNKMYGDIPIRIYRVKTATRPDERLVEMVADSYGRSFYDFTAIPGAATWWIKFHFLRFLAAQAPALDPESDVCTAFVALVWRDLGVDLVSQYAYPTPDMLEKSEKLECIYGEF